eukprot:8858160-Prorocentrum_lima.AAC.1
MACINLALGVDRPWYGQGIACRFLFLPITRGDAGTSDLEIILRLALAVSGPSAMRRITETDLPGSEWTDGRSQL